MENKFFKVIPKCYFNNTDYKIKKFLMYKIHIFQLDDYASNQPLKKKHQPKRFCHIDSRQYFREAQLRMTPSGAD